MTTPVKSNKIKTDISKSKSSGKELKTEGPLSEKDEVKKAEEKIRKQLKGDK
ncbi:hypothetical protein SNE25_10820 [Mucilaginibacter sabulilitoris]|uniref:Uncharacterized protein n=1 Tax=Mucilaginibacter sabulilitoris TaxID=1173583 RepID=A0ABZ0TSC6_9SPHI|nr:hypothetical protein [Mucilaginibacter sabulilitoris]WPU96011.1 hypothetical protein SNE25_10820 [Mucilaginibacter sabulilitoris]